LSSWAIVPAWGSIGASSRPPAIGGLADGLRARTGAESACMWKPHCWQYANPSGVWVPQRGQVVIAPWGAAAGATGGRITGAGDAYPVGISPSAIGDGGTVGGIVGSGSPSPGAPPSGPYAGTAPSGPDGRFGIGVPTQPPPGIGVGPDLATPPLWAGIAGALGASELPQLRQNFIPGGFSPWHTAHTTILGNPAGGGGVCARELPQFRQNDDPPGLSWPHIEQRIVPLTLNPIQVSQQPQVSGMGAGRFATP
jgi:hypothetical protein